MNRFHLSDSGNLKIYLDIAYIVTLSTLSIFIEVSILEIYNLFSVVKFIIRLCCLNPFLSASSKQILFMFVNSFMHA